VGVPEYGCTRITINRTAIHRTLDGLRWVAVTEDGIEHLFETEEQAKTFAIGKVKT